MHDTTNEEKVRSWWSTGGEWVNRSRVQPSPPFPPSFYIASWETTAPESRSRSRSSTLLSSTGSGLPSIQFVLINRLAGFLASSRPTGRAIFPFVRLILGVFFELWAKYCINTTFKKKKKKELVISHFSLLINLSIFSRSIIKILKRIILLSMKYIKMLSPGFFVHIALIMRREKVTPRSKIIWERRLSVNIDDFLSLL